MAPEEIYRIKSEGKSMRQIAAMIPGATKNKIAGILYRYRQSKGLTPAGKHQTQPKPPKAPKNPRLKIVKSDQPERVIGAMSFRDAADKGKCLWFIGNLCCGDERLEDRPYCEAHHVKSLAKRRA